LLWAETKPVGEANGKIKRHTAAAIEIKMDVCFSEIHQTQVASNLEQPVYLLFTLNDAT
jgi:hypothetical protein